MTGTQIFDRTGFEAKFGSLVVPGLNVSTAFNPVPIAKTGEWLASPSGATATLAMTLNLLYFTPIVFPDAASLESIAAHVTIAGTLGSGGTFNRIELAIYNDDGSGNLNPGTLLLDAGHIDATSTTWSPNNILTISQTLPSAGLYWLAAVYQADGTTPGAPTVTAINTPVINFASASATPYTPNPVGYFQSGVTGSLPGTPTVTRTGASGCPRVLVQHA